MAKKQEEWTEEEWNAEDNAWYQKARETAEALMDREPFSYDPGADPLYRTAKDQYTRLGRRAMEDSLGRAAALSGGYASSYAQTQGEQAYSERIARLAELLPDYYDRARSAYDRETGALRDALGDALGLYDKDYQAWLDRQSARERAAAAETENERWERKFAEDHTRWETEFADDHERWTRELLQEAEQWAAQQAASAAGQANSERASERSYAYRMAMLALQHGLRVSDALLEAAGIDKAYAETIRRYYASQQH